MVLRLTHRHVFPRWTVSGLYLACTTASTKRTTKLPSATCETATSRRLSPSHSNTAQPTFDPTYCNHVHLSNFKSAIFSPQSENTRLLLFRDKFGSYYRFQLNISPLATRFFWEGITFTFGTDMARSGEKAVRHYSSRYKRRTHRFTSRRAEEIQK